MPEQKAVVLVVEDERPIADLIRLYLQRDGYGVQVEADGAAGLVAAHLQWHLERGLRSLPLVDRGEDR